MGDPTILSSAHRAPGGRRPLAEVHRQSLEVGRASFTSHLLDTLPTPVMILNDHRQVVHANTAVCRLLGRTLDELLGSRPGEVLGCDRAWESDQGCGTGEVCMACGTLKAILAAQDGQVGTSECRISRTVDGQLDAVDLRVRAAPLKHSGEPFIVFCFDDISAEKRRVALEHIFFHDILNGMTAIQGFVDLVLLDVAGERSALLDRARSAIDHAVDEIRAQRTLARAERHELEVDPQPVDLGDLVDSEVHTWSRHAAARDREVAAHPVAPGLVIETDPVLLHRIVGNMVLNALEAAPPHSAVTVRAVAHDEGVRIEVHNVSVMPRAVQLQVFRRSFSTKGAGRGLGTWSMKLLSGYLQGEVGFVSTEDAGTTFWLQLPVIPDAH